MNHIYTFKLKKKLGATYRKVRGHDCLRALLPAEGTKALKKELGATYKVYGGTAA